MLAYGAKCSVGDQLHPNGEMNLDTYRLIGAAYAEVEKKEPWCDHVKPVARIAQEAGIQLLAIHGRTRACAYNGEAEYDTIAAVKAAVNIPVIANGDITTPEKARHVLQYTRADAVMIGRFRDHARRDDLGLERRSNVDSLDRRKQLGRQ